MFSTRFQVGSSLVYSNKGRGILVYYEDLSPLHFHRAVQPFLPAWFWGRASLFLPGWGKACAREYAGTKGTITPIQGVSWNPPKKRQVHCRSVILTREANFQLSHFDQFNHPHSNPQQLI